MKISHSKINTYNECGVKYKLNYVDRIKPITKSSAFIFGGAIDDASEAILLGKGNGFVEFEAAMLNTDINGVPSSVPGNPNIKYFSKDLQFELLDDKDKAGIEAFAEEKGFVDFNLEEFIEYCIDQRKAKKKLPEDEQSVFSLINFYSLMQKGQMMLTKFKEWADENIEEVYEIQRYVTLENGSKDIIEGYFDFKAKFKDGITRIVDLKTSSDPKKQYPDGCADTAQQLTIYAELDGTYDVAYYILDKVIRKREPRVRDRFITGKISEETGDKIFDNIEQSMVQIKEEVFEHNWDSCKNFGGCEYWRYCRSGGEDVSGLVKLKEKK